MSTDHWGTFELLPAIDLRGGHVVRLRQGDFARETIFDGDPVAVASRFATLGATWLHVVDLDGARDGEPRQLEIAAAIVAETHGRAHVEVGGGLRTIEAVAGALGTGAARVAVGTAALRDPEFAVSLIEHYGPERIVASIDIRDGLALGDGWRAGAAGVPAVKAIEMLSTSGIDTFEVTVIDRDGLLGGPDVALLRQLVQLGRGRIIASGGIASIEHVLAVQAAGCAGAIIGRAIYEGHVDLGRLLDTVRDANR
ncbi:MAG: 1-(5-phosphoribosyl)-5-[(5-phosphoribosylamino)methylideneamino] imidazole-4-carboxamide isomerase [Candidatus Limnocylindrales bacterium]